MSRRHRYRRPLIPAPPARPTAKRLHALDLWQAEGLELDRIPDGPRTARLAERMLAGDYVGAVDLAGALERDHPGHPLALMYAGIALWEKGEPARALMLLQGVAPAMPRWSMGPYHMGLCLQDLGRPADAEAMYREALALCPAHVPAKVNLAAVLGAQGQTDEADQLYVELADAPNAGPESAYHLGMVALRHGDWARGFDLYEARYRMPLHAHTHRMPPDRPIWTGVEGLDGKRLLVHFEQGLGDTLMAAGYMAELQRRQPAEIHWRVQAPLVRLLAAQGWNVTGPDDALPATDYTVPTMSLPRATRLVPSMFPKGGRPAYLTPKHDGPPPDIRRVGFRHAGSADHLNDRQRSTKLGDWAPLFAIPGLEWVDLAPTHGMDFYGLALDLMDLDLVITVDTAVLHLAGALGVPTWGLLANPPDWRWGKAGEATQWYRSVRLFRQATAGDWAGVFRQVASALGQTRREAA